MRPWATRAEPLGTWGPEYPDVDVRPILADLQASHDRLANLDVYTDMAIVWWDGFHGPQAIVWPMSLQEGEVHRA